MVPIALGRRFECRLSGISVLRPRLKRTRADKCRICDHLYRTFVNAESKPRRVPHGATRMTQADNREKAQVRSALEPSDARSQACEPAAGHAGDADDPSMNRDSTIPPDLSQIHIGTVIAGRYELLESIGEGGMGT